jgi:uncharacterized Ntn-hydrolase superfamily protein
VTFSIVAIDQATGDIGIAVASKFLAVGSVVPWARAGVGGVATQALANVRYGPDGLAALAGGLAAGAVVASLTSADAGMAERQLGVVDIAGRGATFTGSGCLPWAGGQTGAGYAAQGNILAGAHVIEALATTFEAATGPLPDRLLEALLAADRAGGDRRGRQSAALLVVRTGGGYGEGDDRWIDLRVDDHHDPVPELIRVRAVWRTLMERPMPEDLLVIDPSLAEELRERLTRLGWGPAAVGVDTAFQARIRAELGGISRTGEARPPIPGWDGEWDAALSGWIGVANLEARTAASGLIDPAVLAALREASAGA